MNVVIAEDLLKRSAAEWQASPFTFTGADGKDPEAMGQAVKQTGARALVLGTNRYPDAFYESLERGTLIQRYGVGYDSIPLDLCRRLGHVVGYTPGALDGAVAEHTLALMLAMTRHVCTGDQKVRSGAWGLEAGVDLEGLELGLLGWGPIARRVAVMAHHGFGMKVKVYRRTPPSDAPVPVTWVADLKTLVGESDVISLHLKSVPELRRVVNAELFASFRKGSRFVNTARGALVDEGALHDALASGHLAGAAIDVFEKEPYVPVDGKDLRLLPTVVLAPHAGSNTRGANRAMAHACLRNLGALRDGRFGDLVLVPEMR